MANVTIGWLDDEQTIIHAHFDGRLASWDEQEEAGEQVLVLAKSVSHSVYIVTSFGSDFVGPPSGTGNPFRSFYKFATGLPDHVALVINTQLNPFEYWIINMFLRIHPHIRAKAAFAKTLEEARSIIASHRAKKRGNQRVE